jgi:hypothetical protein
MCEARCGGPLFPSLPHLLGLLPLLLLPGQLLGSCRRRLLRQTGPVLAPAAAGILAAPLQILLPLLPPCSAAERPVSGGCGGCCLVCIRGSCRDKLPKQPSHHLHERV